MPLGYIRALTLLHRTFRRHPPAQRAHVLGRFLSTPLLRALDLIPAGSCVLDIGAGHGVVSRLIAEQSASAVVAVDPDLRKVLNAYAHPRVRFVAGYDDCVRGQFDAITIFDVINRMPSDVRDALFRHAYALLRPGGVLLVKDLDPSARIKAGWNRLQERVADLLRMSVGEYTENESREQFAERMARAGFVDFRWKRIDFGYPHAHIIYTGRKKDEG
jgi:2-polyprenyl-6-hydroxyphenyl methylase/3-demethylubiquinone-9 3-methyltransferase